MPKLSRAEALARAERTVPWTLSSDGLGRISVVLGSSYGTTMEMGAAEALDGYGDASESRWSPTELAVFLKTLAKYRGDLVAMMAASGVKPLRDSALALLAKARE